MGQAGREVAWRHRSEELTELESRDRRKYNIITITDGMIK